MILSLFFWLGIIDAAAPPADIPETSVLPTWLGLYLEQTQGHLYGVHLSDTPPIVVHGNELYCYPLFVRNEAQEDPTMPIIIKNWTPALPMNAKGYEPLRNSDSALSRRGMHVALNHPVQSHKRGDFSYREHAILWPITHTTQTLGGFTEDVTILPDPVEGSRLPRGSIVIMKKGLMIGPDDAKELHKHFSDSEAQMIEAIAQKNNITVVWLDPDDNLNDSINAELVKRKADQLIPDKDMVEFLTGNTSIPPTVMKQRPSGLFIDNIAPDQFGHWTDFYAQHAFGPHRAMPWAPVEFLFFALYNQLGLGNHQNEFPLDNYNAIHTWFIAECLLEMMRFYCKKSSSSLASLELPADSKTLQQEWIKTMLERIDTAKEKLNTKRKDACKEKGTTLFDFDGEGLRIQSELRDVVAKNLCITTVDIGELEKIWQSIRQTYIKDGAQVRPRAFTDIIDGLKHLFRPDFQKPDNIIARQVRIDGAGQSDLAFDFTWAGLLDVPITFPTPDEYEKFRHYASGAKTHEYNWQAQQFWGEAVKKYKAYMMIPTPWGQYPYAWAVGGLNSDGTYNYFLEHPHTLDKERLGVVNLDELIGESDIFTDVFTELVGRFRPKHPYLHPLEIALFHGHFDTVKILVELGIELPYISILRYIKSYNEQVVKILKDSGSTDNELTQRQQLAEFLATVFKENNL